MTSGVLNAVQLSRGQFVTVTSQDTATQTVSQFVFWGLLDFQALKGFDLFSFGREAGATTPAGLNFGNLVIEMDFDPTANPPTPQFTFDASQLALDLAASTARVDGLYSHFPLTLSSFTQAKAGTTPQALGFMSVQTPLTQGSLVFPGTRSTSTSTLVRRVRSQRRLVVATLMPPGRRLITNTRCSRFRCRVRAARSARFRSRPVSYHVQDTRMIATDKSYILVLYNIGFSFLSFSFRHGQVNLCICDRTRHRETHLAGMPRTQNRRPRNRRFESEGDGRPTAGDAAAGAEGGGSLMPRIVYCI